MNRGHHKTSVVTDFISSLNGIFIDDSQITYYSINNMFIVINKLVLIGKIKKTLANNDESLNKGCIRLCIRIKFVAPFEESFLIHDYPALM